jgi:uncharacterized membrane-anchored protein
MSPLSPVRVRGWSAARILFLAFPLAAVAFAIVAASPRPAFGRPSKPAPAASAPADSPSAAPSASADVEADDEPGLELHFTDGPQSIELGHSVTLALPESDRFLDHADADLVLRKMGNLHNEDVLGIVAPKNHEADWFAVIEWADEGHVKDDEPVDADKLLKDMREAQEEANKDRKEQGFKELSIDGFQVRPSYDKGKHHLSWALIVRDTDGASVNFNTRILGRASFVSIDLVTDPKQLETFRGEAMTLLDATTFAKGQRYEDFDGKTDKVAEYGLAGLIAGGVGLGALKLAKVGLIASFWKVIVGALLAAKKAILLAFAAVAAFFKRFFGKKKEAAPLPAPGLPPDGPPPAA